MCACNWKSLSVFALLWKMYHNRLSHQYFGWIFCLVQQKKLSNRRQQIKKRVINCCYLYCVAPMAFLLYCFALKRHSMWADDIYTLNNFVANIMTSHIKEVYYCRDNRSPWNKLIELSITVSSQFLDIQYKQQCMINVQLQASGRFFHFLYSKRGYNFTQARVIVNIFATIFALSACFRLFLLNLEATIFLHVLKINFCHNLCIIWKSFANYFV